MLNRSHVTELTHLLWPAVWVLLLALVSAGCSKPANRGVEAATTTAEPLPVRTSQVVEQKVERYLEVVGTLKADQEVVVSSEVKGTIQELPVDLGSVVRQGQMLARLSPREFQLRVDQAEAAWQQARARVGLHGDTRQLSLEQNSEVRQAKAALDEARLRFERAGVLIKNGDISQERYDEAEIGYRSAEARYQAAQDSFHNQTAVVEQRQAELELARKQLNDLIIRAPLAGMVSQRHVSRGEYIRAETPIVTIVKSNPLRLHAVIPEVAVSSMRLHIPVTLTVDAYPGESFKGTISRISPSLDEKARTLTVEANVENPDGRLRPGLFARAQVLVNQQSPAVMAPTEALLTFAGLTKLFVVENNRVVERVVKTGIRNGNYIEILEGVAVGDRVAVENLGKLTNGLAVKGRES
jgi:RND family efflux transporter MFP subunit